MPGSTFPRVHVWSDDEDVYASDLNAEFDNVINNLNPAGLNGYEDNATQMKIQTSPGGVGTEVLATSLAGEIERLRFVIARMIGDSSGLWYDNPPISITALNGIVAGSNAVPQNRVTSGRVRNSSNDAFPIFLQADGTAAKVTLKATATAFVYDIAGTPYTIATDVSLSGMSVAPAAQNTATVNDALISSSLYAGERDDANPVITISSVGTNISNLVGQYAAFSHGGEYFVARVASTTTLDSALRGVGFDHTDVPIQRVALSNADTITLCRLHWVYVTTAGAIQSSTSNPTFSATQPTSPSIGDYWFNLTTQTWLLYNGSSFAAANVALIGWAIADTTGVKATRSFEFYANYQDLNTIQPVVQDTATVITTQRSNKVSVAGNLYYWPSGYVLWSTASNLAAGLSLASSTKYFLYVTEQGIVYLDTVKPYDRSGDLLGRYHPYHSWRCVGEATTDGSSHFTQSYVQTPAAAAGLYAMAISGNISDATTSSSLSDVSGGSVSLVTTGKPVKIGLQGGNLSTQAENNTGVFAGTYEITGTLALLRDGTQIATSSFDFIIYQSLSGTHAGTIARHAQAASAFKYTDFPPAGKHVYKLQFSAQFSSIYEGNPNATPRFVVLNSILVARETT